MAACCLVVCSPKPEGALVGHPSSGSHLCTDSGGACNLPGFGAQRSVVTPSHGSSCGDSLHCSSCPQPPEQTVGTDHLLCPQSCLEALPSGPWRAELSGTGEKLRSKDTQWGVSLAGQAHLGLTHECPGWGLWEVPGPGLCGHWVCMWMAGHRPCFQLWGVSIRAAYGSLKEGERSSKPAPVLREAEGGESQV